MDLDKCLKTRAADRRWVTRATRELETLCLRKQTDISPVEIELTIANFDTRLSKLDGTQSSIEDLTPVTDLEKEISEAADFREQVCSHRIQAAVLLDKVQKARLRPTNSDEDVEDVASNFSAGGSKAVRLPKLELPKFDGNVTDWMPFWDKFEAIVHNNDTLPAVTKFAYLQSLLDGSAKACIQGLSATAKHYEIARELLVERYGRTDKIVFAHIEGLLHLSSSHSKGRVSLPELWTMQDELLSHVRSLEALGIDGEKYGMFLTPVILSRLPPALRMEWAREGEGKESDLSFLLEFLKKELRRRERSDVFRVSTSVKEPADGHSPGDPKGPKSPATAYALPSMSELAPNRRCVFCGKFHLSEKCPEGLLLSPSERHQAIRQAKVCFRCLSHDHFAKMCTAKCGHCKGKHHVMSCRKKWGQENPGRVREEPPMTGTYFPGGGEGNFAPGRRGQYPQWSSPGASNAPAPNPQSPPFVPGSCGPSPAPPFGYGGNRPGPSPPAAMISSVSGSGAAHSVPTLTALPTARVRVYGEKGVADVTLLFDSGSDRSYVSSGLVKRVSPEWVSSHSVSYSAFGAGKVSGETERNVFKVDLQGVVGERQTLVATEVPVICAPLQRPRVPAQILHAFGPLAFADQYDKERPVTIDVLVGLDYYWSFVGQGILRVDGGPVVQETAFGWVLSGSWDGQAERRGQRSQLQLLCLSDIPEQALRKFWDLESVGIDLTDKKPPDPVREKFEASVTFDQGRYTVALPWKQKVNPMVLDDENVARKRLENQSRKLSKNPKLEQRYNEALSGMEADGVIEEVPEAEMVSLYPTYYMPHRPVVREESVSTKIRPVFDASAKGANGVSLNSCLEEGPCLLPNLVDILIRFRRWRVALTADIEKAFLQIGVRREDRDVHRFLWKWAESVRVMRFVRVPFGNCSSPFLLNATIKHHLAKFPSTRTGCELQENLYVDDWLTGADHEEEACQMFTEARGIMSQAGMSLAKWHSNSAVVKDRVFKELEGKHTESDSVKVLGLRWMASEDCFAFSGLDVPSELRVTKRVVLSFIARFFDPLGFLSPFIMTVKILFQQLWQAGVSWDDPISGQLRETFLKWVEGMDSIRQMRIPRCYFGSLAWSELQGLEIHAFGDASEKGYGVVVYLRVPVKEGNWQLSFVIARSRVAPLKRVTLPRLELLGALLAARMVVFVNNALQNPLPYRCWTDSTVALSWIKSDPNRWKSFVANRVVEIQRLTDPTCWSHCPGKENPADLLTRGVHATQLVGSELWLNGPYWLTRSVSEVADTKVLPQENTVGVEVEVKESGSCLVVVRHPGNPFDIARWGEFGKAVRVVAYVLRFIALLRLRVQRGRLPPKELIQDELSQARVVLFGCVQAEAYFAEIQALKDGKNVPKSSSIAKLTPFLGEDGLLRMKGRLQLSQLAYDEKHPIILPKGCLSWLLVRYQHLLLKHAGVNTLISSLRSQYLIVGVRRLAKSVKRKCVPCMKLDARPCNQPAAPLPRLRVREAPPFSVTGLDYAGPLYCCDFPGSKFYILLFTCAVVRAIHIEVTNSLSLSDFMLAFRRFVARRGLPSTVYSDNAKTFVKAQFSLQGVYGHLAPSWRFIAPRAPWWGGWWERLIGAVKSAVKKSVGKSCLTRGELETVVHEVESCVNSRPLTHVGTDVDCPVALTPSHFLIGRASGCQRPVVDESQVVSAPDLVDRHDACEYRLSLFWDQWRKEYLRNLPPAIRKFKAGGSLGVGSVVLIGEDNVRRMQWPLGVVVELFPGRDGIVRAARLKTARGVVSRPVQRLYHLEVSDSDAGFEDVGTVPVEGAPGAPIGGSGAASSASGQDRYVTQSGRRVAPRKILDL